MKNTFKLSVKWGLMERPENLYSRFWTSWGISQCYFMLTYSKISVFLVTLEVLVLFKCQSETVKNNHSIADLYLSNSVDALAWFLSLKQQLLEQRVHLYLHLWRNKGIKTGIHTIFTSAFVWKDNRLIQSTPQSLA